MADRDAIRDRRIQYETAGLDVADVDPDPVAQWHRWYDDAAAAASIFGTRVAHGMLSASLFSAVIGERLPGHGTIYLGQNLKFTAPVKIGDAVTATVTVAEINAAKRRVSLDCVATVGDTVVIKGDALVLAPSRG